VTFIRPPAVAGQFYPADRTALRSLVHRYLQEAAGAAETPAPGERRSGVALRAIIAPHAGYVYSGAVAARAYAHLQGLGHTIRRVVVMGPAHRVPVRGLAASRAGGFATPLGRVPLDREALARLLSQPFVRLDDEAHLPEHGLEVQLPFLQVLLDDFQLVPLVAGPCAPEDVATVLEMFTGEEDLIVVSSDLSHFHEYEEANRLDRHSALRIEALQPLAAGDACGRVPINGLLHLARQRGWQAHTVDLRNSGDSGGPRSGVVGYGAFIFEGFARDVHLIQ
jgi:AmmeMemoRadiSam system protein B